METSNENQESVRRQLLALSQMSKAELIEKWRDLYGKEPPSYGPVFMRHRLAYRIQELFYGGLSAELLLAIIKNDDPAASQTKKRGLRPGTVIVRMWHDVKHEVIIRTNGYEYQGQLYRSLSAVAKKITGAHWNGNRFFQLGED